MRKRMRLTVTVTVPARYGRKTAESRVRELIRKDSDWMFPADANRDAVKCISAKVVEG